MNRRLKFFTGLAAVHCLFVLFGASGIRLESKGWLGELITYYSCLTGAERGFGFFAPQVSPEARIVYDGTTASGEKWRETLGQDASDEGFVRIANVAGKYWSYLEGGNIALRRAMGASLAGQFLGKNPRAKEVTLGVEVFQFVPMDQYREGKRQSWKRFYEASYRR